MTQPQRHPHYCTQCDAIFYSTSAKPERCSRCDSDAWQRLRPSRGERSMFDHFDKDYDD